ncbi:MAG: APC family permease [Bacteroidota bacterium]
MTEKPQENHTLRKISGTVAMSLVIANMIGTGVFTTTGLLIEDLGNPLLVLLAWLIGGIAALAGALTYAELGVRMPQSGGEYLYLSKLYHPALGFVAGWISLIVGFAAPVAAVAVAFANYLLAVFPDLPIIATALLAVAGFSGLHLWSVKAGGFVQNIITWMKVVLIVGFIVGGIIWASPENSKPAFNMAFDNNAIFSSVFASSLILVMYSYSGWNAAAYVGGVIKNPSKNLPMALVGGTVIVIIIYLAMNYMFLSSVPQDVISGKVEAGHYVAGEIFGVSGAVVVSLLISGFLLSTLSSMIMAGPRIYKAVGEDYRLFRFLAKTSRYGAPYYAVLLQFIVASFLIISFTFETILVYTGFTLSLFSGLTVGGIFILRRRTGKSKTYENRSYPVAPVLFIIFTLWMVIHVLINQPLASVAGLTTIAAGWVLYRIQQKL